MLPHLSRADRALGSTATHSNRIDQFASTECIILRSGGQTGQNAHAAVSHCARSATAPLERERLMHELVSSRTKEDVTADGCVRHQARWSYKGWATICLLPCIYSVCVRETESLCPNAHSIYTASSNKNRMMTTYQPCWRHLLVPDRDLNESTPMSLHIVRTYTHTHTYMHIVPPSSPLSNCIWNFALASALRAQTERQNAGRARTRRTTRKARSTRCDNENKHKYAQGCDRPGRPESRVCYC